MPTDTTGGFEQAWQELHPAFRRSLEGAYQSLAGGGLAVGAALTDADGQIVAQGRNRAYDSPGGPDPLQGTPLAHAELNVLAVARTGWELGACTLWSTQQPCSMCAAAASFTGVGGVRYLAPDPWALASQPPDRRPAAAAAALRPVGPAEDLWVVCANLLFLHSIAGRSGPAHPTVARNLDLEPETTGIVVDLMLEGLTGQALTPGRPLTGVLSSLWTASRLPPPLAPSAPVHRAGPCCSGHDDREDQERSACVAGHTDGVWSVSGMTDRPRK